MDNLKKYRLVFLIFIFVFGYNTVHGDTHPWIEASISPEGVISPFSVACAGTDATAYLLYLPFKNWEIKYYKSYDYIMRRPCINSVANFDSFDLNSSLIQSGGPYHEWSKYYNFPQKLIVKNTTGIWAPDAPVYHWIISLAQDANGYNRGLMDPDDPTYPTLGVGPEFDFDEVVWKVKEDLIPPKPDCCSSVLFIPGLEASRLYMQEGGSENQLWEPNRNLDVEKLYLNTDGTSKNSGIYTRDIIGETNTPTDLGAIGQNIYKSFSEMMDSLVATTSPRKVAEWRAYPYDWRQDVNDIVNNGTQYSDGQKSLISTLQSLVASSTTSKVTIVAHSNGGLIAKAFLKKLQDDKVAGRNDLIDSVDVLVLVAVPQIGTASAVPAILHGYNQRIGANLLMDEVRARELGRNMIGAYGLLPSREYINRLSVSPVTFVDNPISSGATTPMVQNYGPSISSYAEYTSFLFGNEGRQDPSISDVYKPIKLLSSLWSKAESLHDSIDTWLPPTGVRVIEVAGWGLDTIASFEYYPKIDCTSPNAGTGTCKYVLDERPRFTSDGDKTVVVPSAHFMNTIGGTEKYWVDINQYNRSVLIEREHKNILEIDSLKNLISSVIHKNIIVLNTVLKNTEPIDSKNRLRLSVHSPVTIGVYDAQGNFTGKVCPETSDFCYAKDDITNSSYLEFGEGKYINLPEEGMQKVVLQGTGVGTFTYESEEVFPDKTSTTTRFIDIPVTSQTKAEITLNQSTQAPELKVDTNGDGTFDIIIQPKNEFDPVAYLQTMRKIVEKMDILKVRKFILLAKIDDTIKAIQKGKINKAKIKVEQFQKVLSVNQKILTIFERMKWYKKKPQMMTSAEIQTILTMLDTLLNNLNSK